MRNGAGSVIAVMVMLAGCGDSEKPRPAMTPPATITDQAGLSRDGYVVAADRICADINAKADKINERVKSAPDDLSEREQLDLLGELLEEALPAQERAADAFVALPAPAGDERQVRAFREVIRDQVSLLRRVQDAAERGDMQAHAALSDDLLRVIERRRALFLGYGFRECGRDDQDE